MYTSQLFFQTLREIPSDAELISHQLMLRAGLIRKLASGIYSWLPLGVRILRKLENIIRNELNKIGAQEVLLPIIQPATLWQETGRWDKYGSLLLRVEDRNLRKFCFGPTHEEVITDLIRNCVNSYKQFPICLYQIQTKFRDEIRPRFGVMRAREFLMKDAYSFHLDETCLDNTYQNMHVAYCNIFNNLKLNFKAVLADNGDMGGNASHEFQVIANAGEDQIVYSDTKDYAANIELATANHPLSDTEAHNLKIARGIEVGHIFKLGTRYSKSMKLQVTNNVGINTPILMGCYGIGVSRLIAACIEQMHDEHGIIWPSLIVPFKVVIIPIGFHKSVKLKSFCIDLYNKLQSISGLKDEILLEDRNESPGVIFKDHELIGISHKLIINEKLLSNNQIEHQFNKKINIITLEQLFNFFSAS